MALIAHSYASLPWRLCQAYANPASRFGQAYATLAPRLRRTLDNVAPRLRHAYASLLAPVRFVPPSLKPGSCPTTPMAKTLVEQRHGSIGPVTYQGGRYGTIARARVTPTNPRTNAQQNARAIMAAVASEWRGLTNSVRASWAALAAQMPGKHTGFITYTRLNATLVSCGLPKHEEPPLLPAFGILSCSGLTADDTPTITLTQVTSTVAPDKFIIEAAAPVSQGINNVNAKFRRISVVDGHADPAADLDLSAAYVARFGTPVEGQRVTVRITPMKDGFKGVPLAYSAICTAAS